MVGTPYRAPPAFSLAPQAQGMNLGGQQPYQMPQVPWGQRPDITAAAFGLLGGRTLNEGLQNVAQLAPAGLAAKTAMQRDMVSQQDTATKRAAMNAILKRKSGIPLTPQEQAALAAAPEIDLEYGQPAEQWASLTDPQQRLAAGIPATDMRPAQRNTATGEIKFPGGSGTTISNVIGGDNTADAKLRAKLSETEGERWSEIKKVGGVAASRAQDFAVMEELLKVAPQGPITGRLAEMFPGFSSAGDAVNAFVYRLAPTLRVEGSGATSDLEYNGMVRALPSLSKDPVGNQIILETMKAKAQLDVQRAHIVAAYENEEMTAADARKAMMELDQKSILSPRAKALINAAAGTSGDGGTPPASFDGPQEEWDEMTPEERALYD